LNSARKAPENDIRVASQWGKGKNFSGTPPTDSQMMDYPPATFLPHPSPKHFPKSAPREATAALNSIKVFFAENQLQNSARRGGDEWT